MMTTWNKKKKASEIEKKSLFFFEIRNLCISGSAEASKGAQNFQKSEKSLKVVF